LNILEKLAKMDDDDYDEADLMEELGELVIKFF